MLFHAFFLELAGRKYHVDGSSACDETTLTFGKKTLLQVAKQVVGEDVGQKEDSTVVVAGLALSLALVDVEDCGVPEFL